MANGKMLYRSAWRFGGGWMLSDNEQWYGRKMIRRLARRREGRFWRNDQQN